MKDGVVAIVGKQRDLLSHRVAARRIRYRRLSSPSSKLLQRNETMLGVMFELGSGVDGAGGKLGPAVIADL